jgi:hypothetical protein
MGYIEANWTQTPVFALDDYVSIDDIPALNEVLTLFVDFPPVIEHIASIAVNAQNGWREVGNIQFLFLHPIGQPAAVSRDTIESFRNLLRGRRIGPTVINAVEPFSSMGRFNGKWQSYIGLADFYRDAFQ